jgi:hypothetical protein
VHVDAKTSDLIPLKNGSSRTPERRKRHAKSRVSNGADILPHEAATPSVMVRLDRDLFEPRHRGADWQATQHSTQVARNCRYVAEADDRLSQAQNQTWFPLQCPTRWTIPIPRSAALISDAPQDRADFHSRPGTALAHPLFDCDVWALLQLIRRNRWIIWQETLESDGVSGIRSVRIYEVARWTYVAGHELPRFLLAELIGLGQRLPLRLVGTATNGSQVFRQSVRVWASR